MDQPLPHTLIVILGPTGVGKSDCALKIAKVLETEIISSDSRQIYRHMTIGTAAVTEEQQQGVPHHFVQFLEPNEYYSAAQFERDALLLLEQRFVKHSVMIMTGGSMLYIDAVCNGIDDMPTISDETRQYVLKRYETDGLEKMVEELKCLDPEYALEADLKNRKRVLHALEVCLQTKQKFSTFRKNRKKERSFNIIKIGINTDRTLLYDHINDRVDRMVSNGLIDEVRNLKSFKEFNSLNTVGYKELFQFFDGDIELDQAITDIKTHSRNYARKQINWFKRDKEIRWFEPEKIDEMILYIKENL
ncbi:MAG: tRNA (adenosine(37)-N6)-dimethylallyltransferase MiaA [Bacteroidaceae bacterium]